MPGHLFTGRGTALYETNIQELFMAKVIDDLLIIENKESIKSITTSL